MARDQIYRGGDFFDLAAESGLVFENMQDILMEARELNVKIGEMGKHFAKRVGVGMEALQLRPYDENRGDTPDMVSARHSAGASRQKIVIEREAEQKHEVSIWIDSSESMKYSSRPGELHTKKHSSDIMSITLAMQLARHEDNISLLQGDTRIRMPRNAAHMADRLLDISFLVGDKPEIGRAVPPGTDVILFSDFYDRDTTLEVLDDLYAKKLRAHLVMVIDPREVDFDFEDNVELQGMEGETFPSGAVSKIFGDVQSAKKMLHENTAAHRAWLQREAQSRAFHVYLQYTDEPLENGLEHLLSIEDNDVMARLDIPGVR